MFTIYIFCKASSVISDRVVEEYIRESVFFDNDPVFSRPLESTENNKNFKTLQVSYEPSKTPITISCHAVGEEPKSKKEHDEMLFVLRLDSRYPEKKEAVKQWLEQTTQIFMLEFAREEFDEDDDAWMMLDHVEALIAEECEGVICADNIFFNEKLKKIYKL